jgi:hypothetical protein
VKPSTKKDQGREGEYESPQGDHADDMAIVGVDGGHSNS